MEPLTRHILVVDDDQDIREFLTDRLESYGYVVTTAADGRAALQNLNRSLPNGLILDIKLPLLNGLEVLHWVRDRHPSLPVVIVTADHKCSKKTLSEHAQEVLFKPLDAVTLRRVVNRWFASHS